MILVTLGSTEIQFDRLIDYVLRAKIDDEIIIQTGANHVDSEKTKFIGLISYEEFEELIKEADLVITHGGTGSITTALKYKKKVIACARLAKYNEAVDDHQLEIIETFVDNGYILEINEYSDLDSIIDKSKYFVPRIYKSDSVSIIHYLDEYISNI